MTLDYSLDFNNHKTVINFGPEYRLYFVTRDKQLRKMLKTYFHIGGSPYKGFLINKDNAEELIDFICGTKWPSYIHEFMSQVIETLTND